MATKRHFLAALAVALPSLLVGLNAAIAGHQPRHQPPAHPDHPQGDPLGPDLFIAVRKYDQAQVRTLLEKGANPNQPNWLGISALFWAALKGNAPACATLLEHQADVTLDTPLGGVLHFAAMGGNPEVVRMLLEKKAPFSKLRQDKISELMVAADGGKPEIVQALLKAGAAVNAADITGMTPLMHAARRGQTDCATALIEAGASISAADSSGRTPLMYAALNGHRDTVKLLVEKGANTRARDRKGDSALLLTARYSGDPEVAKLLLKKAGTDPEQQEKQNAAKLALARGFADCAKAIDPMVKASSTQPAPADLPERAGKAARLSLSLLEKATATFSERAPCSSCHHQGLGQMVTGIAKAYGYSIDSKLAENQRLVALGMTEGGVAELKKLAPNPVAYKHLPTVDMDELSPEVGRSFAAQAEHKTPGSEAMGYMATIFARQQHEEGFWGYGFGREPMESSLFTSTAYALQTLKNYLPESLAKEREERTAKALAWLRQAPAVTTEDLGYRLLGLRWAGATVKDLKTATDQLKAKQHPDGGWAQFTKATPGYPGFERSDPYATGVALYALYLGGGVKPVDPVYRKGVAYLLRMQDPDGSWFVNKRAVPANNYLDFGFPHGQSSYISYGATGYATVALIYAAGRETTTRTALKQRPLAH